MNALISPQEAARRIGVSVHAVKAWQRRSDHPLPSVQVGQSGKFLKVIASEIDAWLAAESTRKAIIK